MIFFFYYMGYMEIYTRNADDFVNLDSMLTVVTV